MPRHTRVPSPVTRGAARAVFVALLASVAVLSAGCELFDNPQNVFAPAGEVSRDQKNLFFITMWPALAIMIAVFAAVIYIVVRYRERPHNRTPHQLHGNNRLEIAWTIAPAVLLAFFVVPTIGGIVDFSRIPDDSTKVEVTGFRFDWLFTYPNAEGGPIQAPVGRMHIPVDTNIALDIKATDVIHSFGVPKLAGKTDAIPGRTNKMWLRADRVGEYEGQCYEFCGSSGSQGHQSMRFVVIVQSQEDFAAWLACMRQAPAEGCE